MSEAVNKSPISANLLSWIVWAGILVVALPYAVGFLYAIFALPLYAAACLGVTEREAVVGQVLKPIKEEDYLAFLAGKNCKAPPPQPLPQPTPCVAQGQQGYDPQCSVNEILRRSLGSIDERYRGVHRYFNDDAVARLLGYMGDGYFNAAVRGTRVAIDLHTRSALFRVLVWLFLIVATGAIAIIVKRLSTRIADAIFDRWKGGS